MKRFEGKTLLELGTVTGSVDMVKYAKGNGARVLVADYYPEERSAAKRYADASFMTSATDVEGLVALGLANRIDGVVTGAHEGIIQASRQVAERLHLPIYHTKEQWDRFMRKDSFRALCGKYGITTPATYYSGPAGSAGRLGDCVFPVIVKPVDGSANTGVSICGTEEELWTALAHAGDRSKSGNVIVEQYIDGEEISCTYVLQDHRCKMVCMGTKYPYVDGHGLRALASAYLYPSPAIGAYTLGEDAKVARMFEEEGLDNCTVFVQGMYKDGRCYIFEAGLRMEGTGSYRITGMLGTQNFLHFQVDNALGVPTEYELEKEDPCFGGKKCVLFSQIAKGGAIASVEGYDEIREHPMIFASEQRRHPGDTIAADGTLRQIMFRYLIFGDDMPSVVELIRRIQKTVKAYDAGRRNLLSEDFDPRLLLG